MSIENDDDSFSRGIAVSFFFAAHLLPDVVVGEEAAQLSFGQRPAVVGVTVPGQHADAHRIDLTDVHGSAIDSRESTRQGGK